MPVAPLTETGTANLLGSAITGRGGVPAVEIADQAPSRRLDLTRAGTFF
jgi:hypothetical protein